MIKQRLPMMPLLVVFTFVSAPGSGPVQADEPSAVLNRRDTKKLIKAAEEKMAEYRLTHPMEKKKDESGSYGPNLVEDQDNPLTGKTCTFKVKVKSAKKGIDVKTLVGEEGQTAETKSNDAYVVVGKMKTNLKKFYDYTKLYNDHRERQSVFKQMVKDLRHEVRIKLPSGHPLPEKMPDRIKAVILVTAVEWDHAVVLPTMIIHSELIESKDLGLELDD